MHAINVTDSSVPLKFDYIPATANETSSLDMLISERVDAPVPEYTNSRSVRNRSSLLAVLDMDIASETKTYFPIEMPSTFEGL
ncbi:hypothetical protein HDU99_006066, partial [Rhizoclosmatium hyalinum]